MWKYGSSVSSRLRRLYHPALVLNNPDGLLAKLLTESLFFRQPKLQVSAGVSDLINPMLVCKELSGWAQPGSFGLPFSCPASIPVNHPRMKGIISLPVEKPA